MTLGWVLSFIIMDVRFKVLQSPLVKLVKYFEFSGIFLKFLVIFKP